ncbi:ABC transporter ATP-binding protein [Bradyrhizobium canariense]|uniref:NitT/TauT family transport system ATP-binding protein n=1 Tax=Bradyrhizobium canariense TaxID=255045 RepID=A0A1H1V6F3_9BRAD|nr:ABC transporter ATP-binding protein [Bradyrhizobium canariense]SDS80318.1 NitT/TauT family transport system ATP-binding protein [Bradyrhizobium canariense]
MLTSSSSTSDEPGQHRGRTFITIENVEKKFSTHSGDVVTALAKVNLDIRENEFVSVVGPSGCGKTTLLRILAGLSSVTSGVVKFDGDSLRGPRSDVGIVFQQALLLPWNTVLDNVLLSPHLKNDRSEATRHRAEGLLAFMGLADFAKKYPFELSGGMQQRVAICRALMREPKVLLMDEPFGALDAMTRESLNVELMRVCSEEKKTVLFITHSIPEAVLLGDRVVVMSPRPGRISEIIDVDIARPRRLKTMANRRFGEICDQIRTIFGSDAPMVTAL